MKKNIFILLLLASFGLISGCAKKYDPENPIVGLWVLDTQESVANQNVVTFHRATKFNKDKPGYQIIADGSLVSHQNSSDCGTPPIAYEKAQGDWARNNNAFTVNGKFWGGTYTIQYEINQLDANKLQLKQVSIKYNYNMDL